MITGVTVNCAVPKMLPLVVEVAVMVIGPPAFTPVATPEASTVAMVVSEEVHFTLTGPVEPSEKWPVAENGCVSPAETLVVVGATVMDCSVGTTAVFVREKFAVTRPVAAAVTTYGPPAVAFAVNG